MPFQRFHHWSNCNRIRWCSLAKWRCSPKGCCHCRLVSFLIRHWMLSNLWDFKSQIYSTQLSLRTPQILQSEERKTLTRFDLNHRQIWYFYVSMLFLIAIQVVMQRKVHRIKKIRVRVKWGKIPLRSNHLQVQGLINRVLKNKRVLIFFFAHFQDR